MNLAQLARTTTLGLAVSCGLAALATGQSKPAAAAATSTLVYVGFENNQAVNIYQPGHSGPVGQLVDGLGTLTGGIAIDQQQNVYVAPSPGWVVAYPREGLLLVPGLY